MPLANKSTISAKYNIIDLFVFANPFPMGRMWHKFNFYVDYNWFEFFEFFS